MIPVAAVCGAVIGEGDVVADVSRWRTYCMYAWGPPARCLFALTFDNTMLGESCERVQEVNHRAGAGPRRKETNSNKTANEGLTGLAQHRVTFRVGDEGL